VSAGWRICELSELTPRGKKNAIVDGPFGSNLKTEHYRPTGIPVVTSGFVTSGRFAAGRYVYVDQVKFDQERRSAVHPGDIVMAKIGARSGASAVLPRNHPVGILSGNALKITIDESRHSTAFVASLLGWLHERGELDRLRATGAQPAISMPLLKRLRLAVPPRAEQVRIAEAVGDCDDWIDGLERFIVKKQAIKQGIMRQLLTRGTRLRGFTASWLDIEVGCLLEFKNGLNKGSEFFGDGTPIVNFMDVMDGPIITAAKVAGRVTLTGDEIKRFSVRRGDLFFTRTSETVDEVGTAAVFVDDITDASFSGFILRGRPKTRDVDSRFLARAFALDVVRAQVTASATYTTRALINGQSLGRVVISLPPIEEQRAIAAVIDDADAEIAALQSLLRKARAIRTGVAQEVLTGHTRLPMEAAS